MTSGFNDMKVVGDLYPIAELCLDPFHGLARETINACLQHGLPCSLMTCRRSLVYGGFGKDALRDRLCQIRLDLCDTTF